MAQLVKKRRPGWAVLVVTALVASLFAVGTGPAAAVEIDNSNLPRPSESTPWSACVGDALAGRGFTDVSMASAHYDDINCLSYYGITMGTTADTYSPGDNVSRWQMARFMERAASLTGADADEVLGDFEENGSDPVTRADMAVLLVKLLASAAPHVVQVDPDDEYAVTYGPNGARDLDDGDGDPRTGPLDYFADARQQTPRRVDSLISAAFELGITRGTGDGTTFEPASLVTRAQMASFIMRTVAHTDVRPAGLTAQSSSATVQVSLRDSNYQPIVNEWIDAFYVNPDRVDGALTSNGSCTRLPDTAPADTTRCQIDKGDNLTQADGNVEFTLPLTFVGDARTLWTWTGDLGDEYEDGETDVVQIEVVQGSMAATRALVTSNMRSGATEVRYGAKITFTIQLQHYNATTGAVLGAVPLRQDFAFRLTQTLRTAPTIADDGTRTDGGLIGQTVEVITIGTDGTAEFVVSAGDPRPHRRDNDAPREVEWSLVPVAAGTTTPVKVGQGGSSAMSNDFVTVIGEDDSNAGTREDLGMTSGYVQFDDDAGMLQRIAVLGGNASGSPSYEYQDSGEETAYVTVSAINEYGEPVGGVRVKVAGTDPTNPDTCAPALNADPADDTVPFAREYQTNRFGTARIPHTGPTGSASNTQQMVAVYPGSSTGAAYTATCAASEDGGHGARDTAVGSATPETGETQPQAEARVFAEADLVSPNAARHTLHWVRADSTADTSQDNQAIAVVNTQADEIVAGAGATLVIVRYDDNDEFKVNGVSKSMAKFEEALEYATGDSRITAVLLDWSGYDYRDPDEITEWELTYTDIPGEREPLG